MGTLTKSLYMFSALAQRVLTPGLNNSQCLYKEHLIPELRSDIRWLDLGCGHQILPEWMPGAESEQSRLLHACKFAVGIDGDHLSLRKNFLLQNKIRGDIERLPFQGHSFELVTANVVVEHVRNPRALLAEVHRVLSPGGRFLFHTPNFWGYATLAACLLPAPLRLKMVALLQARTEEDVFPAFYRLNTARSVRELAEDAGFCLAELHLVESSPQTVMLGPVVLLELLWIAALRIGFMKNLRTNLIVVLQKPQ